MSRSGWVLLVVSCLAGSAQAAAYKCKDGSGKVTYSDKPCEQLNQRGDKIFERGAGYNSLNEDEKQSFIAAVTQSCMSRPRSSGATEAQWRAFCDCSSAESAKIVKIEDLRSLQANPRNKAMETRMRQLGEEAGKLCFGKLTSPPATSTRDRRI